VDLPAACCIAGEFFLISRDHDGVDRIEGAYAKWRAGSPLALKTMTGDNQFWRSRERQCEGAATALGISHWKNLRFLR
jgi:hypothetical protein